MLVPVLPTIHAMFWMATLKTLKHCSLARFVSSPLVCLLSVSLLSLAILNEEFPPSFPLKHQQKDLRLALALGDEVNQPLPMAASANEVKINTSLLVIVVCDLLEKTR